MVPAIVATNPACTPIGVVSGSPVIEDIVVTKNAASPIGVVAGNPIIDAIVTSLLFSTATITDIITGSPVVPSITARVVIATPLDVVAGTPDIGTPLMLSNAASPVAVLAGSPVIDSIVATSIGAQVPDVISGVPVVPSVVAISMSGNVAISDLVSGIPDIPEIITSRVGAVISDVATESPIVPDISVTYLTAVISDLATGTPVIGSPSAIFEPLITDHSVLAYICTLTGSPDIELPISYFQSRLRSGESSYLSVNIPGIDHAEEIADRSNGEIIIEVAYLIGGTIRQQSEIIRVNLDDIKIYSGPINKSITLTGYKQETYTPKSIELEDHIYYSQTSGEHRFRFARPNIDLHPGDEVTVGIVTFTANVVSYFVKVDSNLAQTQMEISES